MNVIYCLKRHACLVSAIVLLVGQASFVCAQQKVLIDFGNGNGNGIPDGANGSYRGISVPNPDPNGHHWNSNSPGNLMPLVDITNAPVVNNGLPMQLGWISGVGTDSYNGAYGAGTDAGTPAEYMPFFTTDLSLLGDLGVKQAAFDYATGPNPPEGLGDGPGAGFPDDPLFQGPANATKFDLIGLDPAKKYTLIFYGSHAYNSDATTTYSVFSDVDYTIQIGTVDLDVHHPKPEDADENGESVSDPGWRNAVNTDTVATISNLSPGPDTNLYISFIGKTGYYGYLNAMEVIATTPAGTTGDYNNNGKVDAADYTVWRNNLGQPGTVLKNRSMDVTGNVQQQDYVVWKTNFGLPGSGSGACGRRGSARAGGDDSLSDSECWGSVHPSPPPIGARPRGEPAAPRSPPDGARRLAFWKSGRVRHRKREPKSARHPTDRG